MTPWLAAIDFEVLIWGVLAVIYILGQILSQFSKKTGDEKGGAPWREVPDEIRDFLEEIKGQTGQEELEEEDEPPPSPPRAVPPPIRPQAAPPPRAPAPARPSAVPAYRKSAKKAGGALEQRRHQFQCQLQKQADKLTNRRLRKPHRAGLVSPPPAELTQKQNMAYLSAGLKGFHLPSLGLPSASASLQERTVQHPVSLESPDKLRQALVLSIILDSPVSEKPPGYKNLATQS